MMGLAALMKVTTALVTIAGLTIGVEGETGETRYYAAVEKQMPEVKQSSTVKITINGKELLKNLQANLEPLRKMEHVVVRGNGNSVVLTCDTMNEELAQMLERARALIREHPGRIEIVREQFDDFFRAQEQREHLLKLSDALVSQRVRPYVFEQPGAVRLYISDRYAYPEKDRDHAAELERNSRDLARQYRRADEEAGRTEVASKLRANLNELFDLKLKGYTEKMSSIESEVERLRQRVEERKKNKELIVTGRFKELVGEDNHLRW